jgi:CheY-like chemotaxis protein
VAKRNKLIRVLVVDDLSEVVEVICKALTQLKGVEVVGPVGNGKEALTEAETLELGLILMDLETNDRLVH